MLGIGALGAIAVGSIAVFGVGAAGADEGATVSDEVIEIVEDLGNECSISSDDLGDVDAGEAMVAEEVAEDAIDDGDVVIIEVDEGDLEECEIPGTEGADLGEAVEAEQVVES